ncbi:OmpH family outer membrane protein [Planctomycetota bacterium]
MPATGSTVLRPAKAVLLIGAAVLLVGSLCVPKVAGQSRSDDAQKMKLGVVDLGIVFKRYKKSAELEKRINEEKDELTAKLKEQKEITENIADEMDVLDPDSETYRLKAEKQAVEAARFEYMKRRLEYTIKRKWEDYNRRLLADIDAAVKAYGEDNGYTLILKMEGRELGEQKLIEIGLMSVLYYSKQIDITEDIVRVLNKRHSMGQPSAPSSSKDR